MIRWTTPAPNCRPIFIYIMMSSTTIVCASATCSRRSMRHCPIQSEIGCGLFSRPMIGGWRRHFCTDVRKSNSSSKDLQSRMRAFLSAHSKEPCYLPGHMEIRLGSARRLHALWPDSVLNCASDLATLSDLNIAPVRHFVGRSVGSHFSER